MAHPVQFAAGMRHSWLFLLAIGCGTSSSPSADLGYGGGDGAAGSPSGGDGQGSGMYDPGQLTAGEFDDNLNPEVMEQELTTLFGDEIGKGGLPISDRVVATIFDGDGLPLPGAMVEVADANGALVQVPTGTDGRVLLLPQLDGFADRTDVHLSVSAGGLTMTQPLPASRSWKVTLPGSHGGGPQALDLAFVIDTTGSMGDELQYIQAEIKDIASRVAADHPDVSIRYGLVLYRDVVDPYVTRTFAFTDNLDTFQGNLAVQSADGGGDYPEAAEVGMQQALQLEWRSGNVARVLFHIADAPPHDNAYGAFLEQVAVARASNIRIYPVGASGVGVDAEYLMRLSAMTTAARYLFLTDDSGIGNTHEIPHVPCYQVEHLNDLMVRMIASELEGHYLEADPADVIRTFGTFTGPGVCGPAPQLSRSN